MSRQKGRLAAEFFIADGLEMPDASIPPFNKLAGKAIELDTFRLDVGVPEIRLLKPAESFYARLVTASVVCPIVVT